MEDFYKRIELVRPTINHRKNLMKLGITLIVGFGIALLIENVTGYNKWIMFAVILFTSAFIRRIQIAELMIRLYQLKAPAEVRLVCNFEPTCSEYMILAIKKYGLIRGVIKGIKRIRRCHYPNCGIDYP